MRNQFSLRLGNNSIDEKIEKKIINEYLPDIIEICSNQIRAGIIHMLVNSPETGHSMKVEKIAYRLGTYHTTVLHHLERLRKWELVLIRRNKDYGKKKKRSIWGLNLNYPNWIFEVYNAMMQYGFSEDELIKICNKNQSFRNSKKKR